MSQAAPRARTGGQILVDQLRIHGVEMAFGVPGESYLAVLDALYDHRERIRFIINRQEGGSAFMADAYSKLTGKPGICFVTRGPGATNASIGIHTAFQDSTPLILFIGQVAGDVVEREGFQEIDFRRMYGEMAKWVAQIDRADRVPEYVSRAFHTATSGRPGPVVLALPEDMLTETAVVADAQPWQRVPAHPGADQMTRLHGLLAGARRPMVIVGGSVWDAPACANLKAFVTANNLPVVASFRRQDLLDNRDPHYAGDIGPGPNPALVKRIRAADLLLVVGSRLGEMATQGYTLIDTPRPAQTLVHVHGGPQELGRVYQTDLAINASMIEFAAALAAMPAVKPAWDDWTRAARADYEAWLVPTKVPGNVDLAQVLKTLAAKLPADTIIANCAGNYATWVHRFHQYTGLRTQLAPTSGAMGYSVPAGVAAKIAAPERTVVAISGDGCFLMNGQELATAAQFGANLLFLVVNNGMFGTIRMHQERHYPERISGTQLANPDFAALARAYGGHGEVVEKTADFEAALERARAAKTFALIELRVDPEAITPRTTITALREEGRKAKA
jgi:acetolactate synthase-1/2/3 large subunit